MKNNNVILMVILFLSSSLFAQNLVKNGGFDDVSEWVVVEHTIPNVTTIDLPYTGDATKLGDSSCVRFYVDGATEARPLIYQKLSLVAGESYRVTAAMKIDSFWGPTEYPPGPWFQLYMSTEEPPPAGPATMDWNPNSKLINIMPWGNSFQGVDTFADLIGVDGLLEDYSGGNDFNNNNQPIYTAQGTAGETVDVWIVLKPGMWMDPTLGGFEVLFDNVGVYHIEPEPEPLENGNVVLNSGFENDAVWETYSYRSNQKPDYEFGHTEATPTWGSGGALRVTVSGETEAQRAFFQPVELLAGHTYRFTGAITLLDLQPDSVAMPPGPWFQVYLSKQMPQPLSGAVTDYDPAGAKIVNIMPWGDCFRDDIYDIDGFWESEMGCADMETAPYFTPDADGTYYLTLKFGMSFNEPAGFDVVVDNVMLIDITSNVVQNPSFEDTSVWETLSWRENQKPDYEMPYTEELPKYGTGNASLRLYADSTNTAQRGFFQPVDLKANVTYMASGAITLKSFYPEDLAMPPGPWYQYYLSKEMPLPFGGDVTDYNPAGTKILNIMPWGDCFRRDMLTIDGFWESEMGCSDYATGPYFTPDEDGTYYVTVKVGMNLPEGTSAGFDVLIDDVALYSVGDPFAVIVGVEDEASENLPEHYALYQNYPNPFNPSTKIEFSLVKSGITTLKVYNILGQEVMSIVNKELNAGKHEFEFDASRLSSGTYFYRLTSGDYVDVKKMLLLK